MDKRRFEQLWARCATLSPAEGSGRLFSDIERRYTESHRRYHTPRHVDHCLGQFDCAQPHMREPDAVELAIWYHDVVYDIGSSSNERESAALFLDHARGVLAQSLADSVYDLIMVTVHLTERPSTLDQEFMVDIDLSSFGLPWERFIEDSVAVREEFPQMADAEFYPKQHEFLASLLERENFCFTEFFRARHEERARDNIARYLEGLASKGLI